MKRIVPEFKMRSQPERRAGFIPSDDRGEVEIWQLWCRTADGEDAHRATFREVRKAGFVRRNSVGKAKASGKPESGK